MVKIPYSLTDKTIEEERQECRSRSIHARNLIAIPLLRDIAKENPENKSKVIRRKMISTESGKKPILPKSKNDVLSSGEFSFLLNTMDLFYEDYSEKTHCLLVYRKIEKGLIEKVEDVVLITPFEEFYDPNEKEIKDTSRVKSTYDPSRPIVPGVTR
ncbi:MAG: hypothetical protein KDK54_02280 [Leptospiraceae bacterium]|nr:hypothetical protein [Leptospiraceae bacterium]